MELTIDWKKYVDAIYCIHYEPLTFRIPETEQQLARMDILNSGIFQYWLTRPDPNQDDRLASMHVTHPDFTSVHDRKKVAPNITFGYYDLFHEILKVGHKNVLILEDDIEPMSTKDVLLDTLDHLPEDWDYVQFDRLLAPPFIHMLDTLEPGRWFCSNFTGGYWGTAFTMWSQRAVERAIQLLDEDFVPSDYILINRKDTKADDLHRYVSMRFLIRQINRKSWYYNNMH